MNTEIQVDGKTYVSSKRAAEITGYAQDYVGQLARKGLIDAKKVGGLWYVEMDSLTSYDATGEVKEKRPETKSAPTENLDSIVSFDGKEFISSRRATEISGYSQDYVGQLAREGKVPSRQVGSRWYVAKDELIKHKEHNDALLAAVQSQSVGLKKEEDEPVVPVRPVYTPKPVPEPPVMRYISEENKDLFPKTAPKEVSETHFVAEPHTPPPPKVHKAPESTPDGPELYPLHASAWNPVPMHKDRVIPSHFATYEPEKPVKKAEKHHKKVSYRSIIAVAALSIAFPSIFVASTVGMNLLGNKQTMAKAPTEASDQYVNAKNTEFTAAAAASQAVYEDVGDRLKDLLSSHHHFGQ